MVNQIASPEAPTYPYLRVQGPPRERGRQYGLQAAERVALNISHYRDVFLTKYGTRWDAVLRRAHGLLPRIQQYDVDALAELEGIAEGSGHPVEAIVALNSRTEIVSEGYLAQCTTTAVLPERSRDGHTLLIQNWDWMRGAQQTSVLLHVITEDDVEYLSLHEAGWLVRGGLNSHGVGCVGNFVASAQGGGSQGIPLPIIGHRIMLADTIEEAARLATAGPRSIAINYLMASAEGSAVDIETTSEQAYPIESTDGLLVHTNHYLTPDVVDLGRPRLPDSVARFERMHELLSRHRALAPEDFFDVLADHDNHPSSICRHPSKEGAFAEVTLASTVMDLDAGVMWMTQGPPCETEYQRWDVFGRTRPHALQEVDSRAVAG